MRAKTVALLTASLVALAGAARADVSISGKPTANMSCISGVCTATAQKAVLNVGDLQGMLATGDVAVKTGSLANDIEIAQPLTWSSTARLTLDAQRSVTVKKQVTVAGQGALTIVTNDTGSPKKNDGEFIIVPEHGSVQFWDLASSLIIDGHSYTLVGDIKTLAADIAADPNGFYALAKPYDASADGTYSASAITTTFQGTFDGLGNSISNFTMSAVSSLAAFFKNIALEASVRDFGLINVAINGAGNAQIATIAGESFGTIISCWATGNIKASQHINSIGGLVAGNDGLISRSFSRVKILSATGAAYIGGLAAGNGGMVARSYSTGSIHSAHASNGTGGALVGIHDGGELANDYSTSEIRDGRRNCCEYGGLVGRITNSATINNVYAAGQFRHSGSSESVVGGVVGYDATISGSISKAYWDLDKGVSNPSQGAGNIPNDPGITGLTDAQLKSGLPAGFDPNVWGQKPDINNGYPYLLANPPQ